MLPNGDPIRLSETSFFHGTPIRWIRLGRGPPLIFVHGTPWSAQLWAPIARCFAARYTVYLYDLLGYGSSIPPDPAVGPLPTYGMQGRLFVHLLREWADEDAPAAPFRPHVVAHDIGGHIALRAMLIGHDGVGDDHLDTPRFASLCLVDCGAAFPVNEPFFTLMRDNSAVFKALPAPLHEALVRRYVAGAAHRGLRRDDEDMLVRPWLGPTGQAAFYRQYAFQNNAEVDELAERYRSLDGDEGEAECPLRILWGRHDAWVPVERAHRLQEKIGGSLRIIEGAGHLVQLDAPEELTFELAQWLQEVGAADRATGATTA